jgi:hypothetical protein
MPAYTHLLSGLRVNILAALAGSPSNRELNRLVEVCHSLALAAIHGKCGRGLLVLPKSNNPSDLAFDCIGELFRRDDQGSLVRIKAYFQSFDVDGATDEDLLAHLRRLVFSAVNQGLFRMYSDVDPAIGRIIRNIKLTVRSLENFIETDRLGEPCIAPALCDPLAHLPPVGRETLETELTHIASGLERIPEVLAKLSLCLRNQSDHSRLVPIVSLAHAIRGLYAVKQIAPISKTEEEGAMLSADVHAACRWAATMVRHKAQGKYTARGKVTGDVLDRYFEAVEEYLGGKLNGGPNDFSLCESTKRAFPGLTNYQYDRIHRARVEYLARQVERLALKRLRDA